MKNPSSIRLIVDQGSIHSSKFGSNPLITFWDILVTDRETDRKTDWYHSTSSQLVVRVKYNEHRYLIWVNSEIKLKPVKTVLATKTTGKLCPMIFCIFSKSIPYRVCFVRNVVKQWVQQTGELLKPNTIVWSDELDLLLKEQQNASTRIPTTTMDVFRACPRTLA